MEDIPHPSRDPYTVGDRVQIYLDPNDSDIQYHSTICEIDEIHVDDLDTETGRSTDAYSYTLRDTDSAEKLPLSFRHQDLVPADDTD